MLEDKGSPEMQRHWRIFRAGGGSLSDIDITRLRNQFVNHCNPLLGQPIATSLVLILLASIVTLYIIATVNYQSNSVILCWVGGVLAFGCSGFLFTYLVTLIQRRLLWPMEPLLANSIAHALSQRNYRGWLHLQPQFHTTTLAIEDSGVSSTWDNPTYLRWYQREDDTYNSVSPLTKPEMIRSELLNFLGTKNQETRKHIPGPLQSHLKEGKRSVTRFVKANQQQLIELRQQTLCVEDAWSLLQLLLDTEVVPETSSATKLNALLTNPRDALALPERTIQAKVWQRDPWQDLCSQKDFYSSASLRGVDAVGRSTKGRLSPFQYLENASISALDFSDRRGRAVRVRVGLCRILDGDSDNTPILFVDGVEGSNRISSKVILQGLIDYAKQINVDAILFYRFPHNTIPKRFIQMLDQEFLDRECNTSMPSSQIRTVSLQYMNADARHYLDAFGGPIEPFEYAFPQGNVIAEIIGLNSEWAAPGRTPNMWDHFLVLAKRHCLWFILATSMMFAVLTISISAPFMLIPLSLFAATGIWLHLKTQNLGVEVKTKS